MRSAVSSLLRATRPSAVSDACFHQSEPFSHPLEHSGSFRPERSDLGSVGTLRKGRTRSETGVGMGCIHGAPVVRAGHPSHTSEWGATKQGRTAKNAKSHTSWMRDREEGESCGWETADRESVLGMFHQNNEGRPKGDISRSTPRQSTVQQKHRAIDAYPCTSGIQEPGRKITLNRLSLSPSMQTRAFTTSRTRLRMPGDGVLLADTPAHRSSKAMKIFRQNCTPGHLLQCMLPLGADVQLFPFISRSGTRPKKIGVSLEFPLLRPCLFPGSQKI